MRVRGSVDEPAGDWLNDLPQGVTCSRRRLVFRVYWKTGKATLTFKTSAWVGLRVSASPHEIIHTMPMGWQ